MDRRQDVVRAPANETVVATLRSEGDSDLSQAGSVLGTPAYMAPEQARGETDSIDRRADVFALGSILCEILTGEPAFSGGTLERDPSSGGGGRTRPRRWPGWSTAVPTLSSWPWPATAWPLEARDRPADAGVVAGRMTAYLAGVQERLREAELSRAAESARARGGRGQGVCRAARPAADRRAGRDGLLAGAAGRHRLAVGRAPAAGAGTGSLRAGQRRTPGRDPAARPGSGCGGGRPRSLGAGGGRRREGARTA